MGYDVVVIADSTSRWAEALREFASRTGDLPAEEGYPARLASALAAFYERAGRVRTLGGDAGSVTVIGAVSPPGGDMTEPVTAHTRARSVRCVWTLDRDLAYARHYPAVSWRGSFSRDADALARWHARRGDPGWASAGASAVSPARPRPTAGRPSPSWSAPASLPGTRADDAAGRRGCCASACCSRARSARTRPSAAPPSRPPCCDLVLDVIDACRDLVRRGVEPAAIEAVRLRRRRCGRATSPAGRRRRRRRRCARPCWRAWRPCMSLAPPVEYESLAESAGRCSWSRASPASAGTSSPSSASGSGERRTAWCWTSTATSPSCRCSRARRACGLDERSRVVHGRPLQIPVGPAGSAGSATAAASRSTAARRSRGSGACPVAGRPLNPATRAARRPGPHRRLRHRRADHAGTRPEAADLLGRRAAAPRARRQIAAQATAGGEPFSVVFAAMGLTHADARCGPRRPRGALGRGELVLLLNTADDPVIERILTPRIALTVAEHLAFDLGRHVLVVMADMTSYCEALREVSAARGEIPGRRAYPGYLYSDLASLYERCGRIEGRPRVGHAGARADHARRRHHPPGPGPDRLHHRGPDRALAGARPPRASTRPSTRSPRCPG